MAKKGGIKVGSIKPVNSGTSPKPAGNRLAGTKGGKAY